jgi:hypothetical protein
MSKRRILVLGLAIVVLVGLIAAGLQTLEFRAGVPMPELGEPETGHKFVLPFPYAFLERLLDVMPWIILGIVLLGVAVFRRKLFSEFGRARLIISLLLVLALFGLRPWLNQATVSEEELTDVEEAAIIDPPEFWQPTIPSPDWIEDPAQEQPMSVPGWVTYLIAAALAVPLVWLGWWLARRAAQRGHKRAARDELRELAAQASADLRAGVPVEEVVIRCWARMAEILAGRAGETGPAITPRELARLLERWGVHHQAIVELTSLFEEVRYGAKADAPRRERAVAALQAIEEAYGSA